MAEKIIEDVAPELLERVTKRFRALQASDKNIAAIVRRCAQPGATQADVAAYANRLGELLRAALVEEVEPGALPGGRLHLNIAEKLITPQLRACHAMVNRQAAAVQRAIDAADGVGLQTVEAAFPEERLHDLYWTACDPAKKTDPLRMIANETPTAVLRFLDDFTHANAEARYQAGMAPKIERVASFGACKWCRDRAGVFDYEAHRATGDEVFRRHANCGCSVTFINGRERQGVWTKKRWDASEDTRRQRIEAGSYRLTEQTKKATKEIRAQESMEAARLRYAVKHEGEQSSKAIFASARLDALRMERQRVENEVRLRERKRASDALREHGRDQSEKRAARIAYSQEKAASMRQKREKRRTGDE